MRELVMEHMQSDGSAVGAAQTRAGMNVRLGCLAVVLKLTGTVYRRAVFLKQAKDCTRRAAAPRRRQNIAISFAEMKSRGGTSLLLPVR